MRGARRREPAQLEPDGRAGVGVGLLVRRLGNRHQDDAVEPELVARLLGHHEVAEVRRVERPAEDADLSHGAAPPTTSAPTRRPANGGARGAMSPAVKGGCGRRPGRRT